MPLGRYENTYTRISDITISIEKRSCAVCENYRAIHPQTKVSYCKDGSKKVFVDSGCSAWKLEPNG